MKGCPKWDEGFLNWSFCFLLIYDICIGTKKNPRCSLLKGEHFVVIGTLFF